MTERVFRVGQRARVVRVASPAVIAASGFSLENPRDDLGTTVVITGTPVSFAHFEARGPFHATLGIPVGEPFYPVESDVDGFRMHAPAAWLEPYDDGREPAEWTESLRKLCKLAEDA